MGRNKYDVVVAGSGVGGICTAALLARYGYRVLLSEKRERLGGRYSTIEIDGFKVPTGAMALPSRGGVIAEIFQEVGANYNIREMGAPSLWIEGRWHPLPEKGQLKALLTVLDAIGASKARIVGQLARGTATEKILGAFRKGKTESVDPTNKLSIRDWLKQFTDDERVFQVFHSVTSSFTAVNDFEYPVASFFAYLSSAQGGLHYVGIAPEGNVALCNSLAATIRGRGGEVWTSSPVEKILIDGGKVKGVVVNREGKPVEVDSEILVSDLGPKATVELAGRDKFDADYLKQVDSLMTAPIVHNLVASDKPLADIKGMAMIAGTKRIVTGIAVTNTCPELAPPGQHLLVCWGTPASSLHHADKEEEARLNVEDIKQVFPDFERHGRILWQEVRDIDHEFVAYRSWMGYDMSPETQIPNLFHVGDAVKPFGWEGTVACAQGARLIVNELKKRFKPGGNI